MGFEPITPVLSGHCVRVAAHIFKIKRYFNEMLKLSLNATLLDVFTASELGLEPRIFSLNKRCFNLLSYSEKSISVAVNIYKILEPQVEFESTTFSMARRYASQLHHWDKNISYVVSSNQLINTSSGRYYILFFIDYLIIKASVRFERTRDFNLCLGSGQVR